MSTDTPALLSSAVRAAAASDGFLDAPVDAVRLQAGVDTDAMLAQVGAMFQSPRVAMAEIVQNAYRAGATELTVTYHAEQREVMIEDNGCGLESLESLITAARSRWQSDVIVDPAGLGAMALLSMADVVELRSVRADGTAFAAQFDASLFTGGDARTWPIAAPFPHGLWIRVRLNPSANFGQAFGSSHWRMRYPLTVWLNGVEVSPLSIASDEASRVLATFEIAQIGRVAVVEGRGFTRQSQAVWDHRVISLSPLEKEFARAVARLPLPQAAHVWLQRTLGRTLDVEWVVDPSSGVRPKLPDRDVFLETAAFAAARQQIADAVVATLDLAALTQAAKDAVQAALRGKPLMREPTRCPEVALTGFRGTEAKMPWSVLASLAGAVEVSVGCEDVWEEYGWRWDDDCPSPECLERVTAIAYPQYQAESVIVELTANRLGFATQRVDRDDARSESAGDTMGEGRALPRVALAADSWRWLPDPGVLYAPGLRLVTDDGCLVSAVSTVLIGQHRGFSLSAVCPSQRATVGALFDEPDDDSAEEILAIIAHPLEGLAEALATDSAFRRAVFESADDQGTLAYDASEGEVQLDLAMQPFIESIVRVLLGEAAVDGVARHHLLQNVQEAFGDLRDQALGVQRVLDRAIAGGVPPETLDAYVGSVERILATRVRSEALRAG